MLFNSFEFGLFLPAVFILYWLIKAKRIRLQNCFLLAASYFFYAWWDWRFSFLIFVVTLADYFAGLGLTKYSDSRFKHKILLTATVVFNLGVLCFFKYCNFFIDNFVEIFSLFGAKMSRHSLNIILPVGISFYIFQTMSYVIDVYRGRIAATKDFISFASFVAFFPQVMAGPIERAVNFLPQFYVKREFDYTKAVDGMRQMLWGFFKKIAVADNCAQVVDRVFENYMALPGSYLLLGAFFFSIQIYADFSGYSDIAIGCARLFGFDLKRNFGFPYFSRDIAEFWRRWHISLTTWFRDYVYIPLGGSRTVKWKVIRNTFIIFLLSGLWHGANWTFVAWGAINALYFMPLLLFGKNRKNLDTVASTRLLPSAKELIQILFTFFISMVAWVFFRANSIGVAIDYLKKMFSSSLFNMPNTNYMRVYILVSFLTTGVMLVFEWIQRNNQHGLYATPRKSVFRIAIYLFLTFLILSLGGNRQSFIYFQF